MHKILFPLIALLILGSVLTTADEVQSQVLRLHILANSDNAHDQQIKLAVRDRILAECGYLFADCRSAADAAAVAETNRSRILSVAEKELKQQGCLHPVSVRVGESRFPTKQYGKVRLPQGRYTALEVRIGHADGRNWWCVMYPPLCLSGEVVAADAQTLTALKESLSSSAYAMVTEETEITPRIRFKLAEILGKWL